MRWQRDSSRPSASCRAAWLRQPVSESVRASRARPACDAGVAAGRGGQVGEALQQHQLLVGEHLRGSWRWPTASTPRSSPSQCIGTAHHGRAPRRSPCGAVLDLRVVVGEHALARGGYPPGQALARAPAGCPPAPGGSPYSASSRTPATPSPSHTQAQSPPEDPRGLLADAHQHARQVEALVHDPAGAHQRRLAGGAVRPALRPGGAGRGWRPRRRRRRPPARPRRGRTPARPRRAAPARGRGGRASASAPAAPSTPRCRPAAGRGAAIPRRSPACAAARRRSGRTPPRARRGRSSPSGRPRAGRWRSPRRAPRARPGRSPARGRWRTRRGSPGRGAGARRRAPRSRGR